jgi:hypothetical protein
LGSGTCAGTVRPGSRPVSWRFMSALIWSDVRALAQMRNSARLPSKRERGVESFNDQRASKVSLVVRTRSAACKRVRVARNSKFARVLGQMSHFSACNPLRVSAPSFKKFGFCPKMFLPDNSAARRRDTGESDWRHSDDTTPRFHCKETSVVSVSGLNFQRAE